MTIAQPAPTSPSGTGGIAVRFALAFVSGLVLVIAIGGGALFAYGQQYTGKVLPGVSVGDVDLSGLSPEQARAQLESTYGTFADGTITLTGPDGDVTVGYDEIGREADIDAMVSDALTAGRHGETMADLLGAPQTALRGITLTPVVRYDEAKLAAAVAQAAAAIDREPVDATLTAEQGEYTTTDSVDGRTVDQAALLATLDAQLSPLDAPAEIEAEIPYTTTGPGVRDRRCDDRDRDRRPDGPGPGAHARRQGVDDQGLEAPAPDHVLADRGWLVRPGRGPRRHQAAAQGGRPGRRQGRQERDVQGLRRRRSCSPRRPGTARSSTAVRPRTRSSRP